MTAKTRTARGQGLADLAERQYGVISRDQLRACGVGEGAIAHAIKRGRLHRVFRGVYALGHRRIGERGRLMAALLACGPRTVVSHRSAAALLELIDDGPVV